jgi:hypothetical protein
MPKEFKAFEINYNSQPKSWSIEKLIAMCVQEERIKESHGDSVNHMKHHKKKNYSNSPLSPRKVILMILSPLLPRCKAKLPWRNRIMCLRVFVGIIRKRDTTWRIM